MTDLEHEEPARRQEVLIAELNHRTRNILNVIRSLITQTRPQSGSIDDYAAFLSNRIDALARAHDQLSKSDWQPTALRALIEAEAQAYLDVNVAQLAVVGVGVILEPAALYTLSLVLHELVTNSAKYGALSTDQGHVTITLARGKGDGLDISWQETGGPAVTPPTRRGFGSTIIERSVPYELSGAAKVDYRREGLAAHFHVPAIYVQSFTEEPCDAGASTGPSVKPVPEFVPPRSVLIVEDNVLIAMETEENLSQIGCEDVQTVGNLADALDVIDGQRFDFVLLDVNLGFDTSDEVARRLRAAEVPFALSTGFGENIADREPFGDAPILTKPYANEDLALLMRKMFAA